ncbi:response regulator [Spirosoma soli]|uniref:Response regulator n=1 Tax=Spirosoma soli TaxID=1770529 RepID=A0ABW5M962_9BACT
MTSLKILIVEDETITAMDLRETLEEAGHTVVGVARNFQQALEFVIKYSPDLALVDIQLDGSIANGIDTAKELVARRRMPIIYLTANSEPETFQLAKQTLPAAYMLKPFRHDELKLQVELAYYSQANAINAGDFSGSQYVYLPDDEGYERVDTNDVLYLRADGAYAKVFTTSRETPYHVSTNLSHLTQYFATPNFYRLSRSLLINLTYLARIERNYLYLTGHAAPLQIPAANRKELMKKLTVVRTK